MPAVVEGEGHLRRALAEKGVDPVLDLLGEGGYAGLDFGNGGGARVE